MNKTQLNNNKGLVLLPMVILLSLFLLTVYVYMAYKDHQMSLLQQSYQQAIKTSVESGKQDLLAKINDKKFTTNPDYNKAGEQKYDTGTTDTYSTIDNLTSLDTDEGVNALNTTQLLDKIITNRTTNVTRLGEAEPSKKNNVFEIDLVNFLKNDGSLKNSLSGAGVMSDLKLQWGTLSSNSPDVYIIMSRVKKNTTININNTFEELMAKKNLGNTGNYGVSNADIDKLSVDYKRVLGGGCQPNLVDPDIPDPSFRWCQKTDLYDILSNTNLDLNNYIYKVFIVFGQTDTGDSETPFKVYSDINGTFGVGNFVQADVTMMTGENAKKRVVINTATKNNILPYLVYSLWVKGKIEMENEDS